MPELDEVDVRYVEHDGEMVGAPPLMIIPREALNHNQIDELNRTIRMELKRQCTVPILLMPPGAEVFQFIDDRWVPIRENKSQ